MTAAPQGSNSLSLGLPKYLPRAKSFLQQLHNHGHTSSGELSKMARIIGPTIHREQDCEAVLRSLPEWFGIEESLMMYVHDSGTMHTFAIEDAEGIAGFITLRQHFPEAWEIHCIAVKSQFRSKGLGTALLGHAERWLQSQGARLLQVKTISDSHSSPHYAETRNFYLRRGYTPVEVFPTIWHPSNPALQLIKAL